MADKKIVVDITENGIKVKLYNIEGLTATTVERIQYAIVKELQVYRAQKLGEIHKANMAAEAAARTEAEKAKLTEELENAIS